MIKKLSYIFGSKTKAQEITYLLSDAKPVIRQGFTTEELSRVERFCREQNLHLVTSTFKVLFADEGVYSNKGVRIAGNDPRPGLYFVYISKDEQKALLASYHELMNDHRALGLVLGYPTCCVDFFTLNFKAKRTNLQLPPTNPYTNLSKREQDCVLLSHFPCQSDCEKSMLLAKKYLDVLAKVDRERAKEIVEQLKV